MNTGEVHIVSTVTIEYSDQNEAFAPYLPRSGKLVSRLSDIQGNDDWFLVALDAPFDYQVKVGEPYRFKEIVVSYFLIRSRWSGHTIGGPEPTSVFILLASDPKLSAGTVVDPAQFIQAAWGMCRADA